MRRAGRRRQAWLREAIFASKGSCPHWSRPVPRAPVFAKVASAVQAVVDGDEKTSATSLLELTTLVNAILYTQGETGAGRHARTDRDG